MFGCPMWYGWSPWFSRGWNPFSWIFGVLIVGVIILGIWYLLRGNLLYYARKEDSTLLILKEKYAKGEISREEFYQKLDDLKK